MSAPTMHAPAAPANGWGWHSAQPQQWPIPAPAMPAMPVMHAAPASQPGARPVSSVWSELKAPDGRAYYYNSETGETTYDKPLALQTVEERSLGRCPWSEFKDAEGRTYYYHADTKQSQWTEPEELTRYKAALAAIKARAAASLASSTAPTTSEGASRKAASSKKEATPVIVPPEGWEPATTEEGRISDFKDMLSQHKFDPSSKWGSIVDAIREDPRFGAISQKGVRKHAFSEWCDAERKRLREEAHSQAVEARERFSRLLTEHPDASASIPFAEVPASITSNEAWGGVSSEAERRQLYEDWAARTVREEKLEVERRLREQEEALDKLLEAKEREGAITAETTWLDAKQLLAGEPAFEALPSGIKLDVFKRRIIELDRRAREEERRRAEEAARARREAVGALERELDRLTRAGRLHFASKWSGTGLHEFDDGAEAGGALADVPPRVDGEWVYSHSEAGQALARIFPDAGAAERLCQDEFERWCRLLHREWSRDCRAVAALADALRVPLAGSGATSTLEGLVSAVREKQHDEGRRSTSPSRSRDHRASQYRDEDSSSVPRDDTSGSDGLPRELSRALVERPTQVRMAFARVKADEEEEEKQRAERTARRERRYKELLMDYYFRADHLKVVWEQAKEELSQRSAYRDLPRERRRELFEEHMSELNRRAEESRKLREERRRQAGGVASASAGQGGEEEGEEGEVEEGEARPAKRSREESDEEGAVDEPPGQRVKQ
jgi:hypothetical protein